MRYLHFFWLLIITASFTACANHDVTNEKELATGDIYFDYKIGGDEESGEVTVVAQYRYSSPDGETLFLEEPAQVQLDNETLTAGNAEKSGAYYEIRKPLEGFAGNHTITFTDLQGKHFAETFSFMPFNITNEIGDKVPRGDLVLPLDGLKNGDAVRVVLIDTSFTTDDLNEMDTVQNNRLTITKEQLKKVANGPVTLQLYKEVEQKLKNATVEGGKIYITYSISRGFELVD